MYSRAKYSMVARAYTIGQGLLKYTIAYPTIVGLYNWIQ